jgi:hypothetical protein
MLTGDFSDYRNAAGAVVPVYDPLTNCGQYNNPACGSGSAQRAPFPGNAIPANRINPVSAKFVAFPNFALPNIPGQTFTHNFNFSKILPDGGDNDQFNLRGDQKSATSNVSSPASHAGTPERADRHLRQRSDYRRPEILSPRSCCWRTPTL